MNRGCIVLANFVFCKFVITQVSVGKKNVMISKRKKYLNEELVLKNAYPSKAYLIRSYF